MLQIAAAVVDIAFREGSARIPEPSDLLEFVTSPLKYATHVAD